MSIPLPWPNILSGNYKMESGSHHFNLLVDLLRWPKLEERKLQTRLKKARLDLIDILTDHFWPLKADRPDKHVAKLLYT